MRTASHTRFFIIKVVIIIIIIFFFFVRESENAKEESDFAPAPLYLWKRDVEAVEPEEGD